MDKDAWIVRCDRLTIFGFLALLLIVALAMGAQAVRQGSRSTRAGCPAEGFARGLSKPRTVGWQAVVQANARLLQRMRDMEKDMESAFPLRNRVFDLSLPALRVLGASVDEVIPGENGWLFYEPDVRHVIGPGFLQQHMKSVGSADPVTGILDFHRQLHSRAIALLVVPTPVKPSIVPEYLRRARADFQGPLTNVSWNEWLKRLQTAGVDVIDLHGLLWSLKREGRVPYLRTDTHWTPDAVEAVAERVARSVRPHLIDGPMVHMTHRSASVAQRGDIAAMVDRAASRPFDDSETVRIEQVVVDDTPISEDRSARVLLIGDSFSNIYSSGRMGWGEGAGLAEQLAYHLRQPVDRIVHNDAGAIAGRKAIAAASARGRDRLAGKRVVVWQFATRELSYGDWSPVALVPDRVESAANFLTPSPGKPLRISGVVLDKSTVPKPGAVPYADHIVAVYLSDVASADGSVSNGEALVYVFSMRDHRLTEAARLRAGERVCMDVRSWDEVERELGSINRSELDDAILMTVEPCWGELVAS